MGVPFSHEPYEPARRLPDGLSAMLVRKVDPLKRYGRGAVRWPCSSSVYDLDMRAAAKPQQEASSLLRKTVLSLGF